MNIDALVAFYERLQPEDIGRFGEFYAPDARFVDPFNDVVGVEAIAAIFRHMFEHLGAPRFVVTERFVASEQAVLVWTLHCRIGQRSIAIEGASHLHWGSDGRVSCHRDFWDAARGVYEHLPALGFVIRALRRRMSASVPRAV
ncbi:MAG: nuclear transport factor 2 family protein [Rhodocyclaceae bacterium]|nr:nuclear transport factor 2 family protein [Rhodocyclaceae bacterium]